MRTSHSTASAPSVGRLAVGGERVLGRLGGRAAVGDDLGAGQRGGTCGSNRHAAIFPRRGLCDRERARRAAVRQPTSPAQRERYSGTVSIGGRSSTATAVLRGTNPVPSCRNWVSSPLASSRRAGGDAPGEHRRDHLPGHRAERLLRLRGVPADAEVDLGERRQPAEPQQVDRAARPRRRSPRRTAPAPAPTRRPAYSPPSGCTNAGQLGPQRVEQRPGGQLGDPAAAGRLHARRRLQRPGVAALDVAHLRIGRAAGRAGRARSGRRRRAGRRRGRRPGRRWSRPATSTAPRPCRGGCRARAARRWWRRRRRRPPGRPRRWRRWSRSPRPAARRPAAAGAPSCSCRSATSRPTVAASSRAGRTTLTRCPPRRLARSSASRSSSAREAADVVRCSNQARASGLIASLSTRNRELARNTCGIASSCSTLCVATLLADSLRLPGAGRAVRAAEFSLHGQGGTRRPAPRRPT